MKNENADNFQRDLIENRYHIYDPTIFMRDKAFYPKELLDIIAEFSNCKRNFKIKIGETYKVRAFFAISDVIDNEVGFESGFLDLKLIMKQKDKYVGEVATLLPPFFPLKKGSTIIIKEENILYKTDYSLKKNT